jgi:glycosyltransferase involved in cell wall biosynthesis
MSCKKPVLMAIDGISKELIEEAEGGSYVEPENPEAYRSVIMGYLKNKERLVIEGENGFRYVKENFDREVLATRYLEFIKSKVLN